MPHMNIYLSFRSPHIPYLTEKCQHDPPTGKKCFFGTEYDQGGLQNASNTHPRHPPRSRTPVQPPTQQTPRQSTSPDSSPMTSSARNRNANRRQNRGVELSEYEGIPVRHWRRDYVTVAPPSTQENSGGQNDIWAVELPHGMPKDSHLLPQHSQDLLRAARSGKIYKRPAPVEEEEGIDVEIVLGDKPEKKEEDPKDKGFTARAWKQVARNMEDNSPDYLAKRRKGLVRAGAKPVPLAPTLTKATVKRLDAAGNEYVQDVIVPNGQAVEGEVIATTLISDPNIVAADPHTIQPTPPRRKGPVARKKKTKGPGRGRKKIPLPPTSVPGTEGAVPVDGAAALPAVGADGIKIESGPTTDTPTQNESEDVEMGEGSAANSSDEDGEDGDDNEDDEDSTTDAQNSPSKPPPLPALPAPVPLPDLSSPDVVMGDTELPRAPPNILTDALKTDVKSGSPLKNLALTTSTLASPIVENETPALPAPATQSPLIAAPATSDIDEAMQQETLQLAPETLPLPPPVPSQAEVNAAVEERVEEEEEEEMILDIVEKASNSQIGAEPPEAPVPAHAELPLPVKPAATETTLPPIGSATEAAPSTASEIPPIEPIPADADPLPEKTQEAEVEDDDYYPDLLGGLEKSLGSKKEDDPPVPNAPTEEKAADDVQKVEEALAVEDA